MTPPTVKTQKISDFLQPSTVHRINKIVTEGFQSLEDELTEKERMIIQEAGIIETTKKEDGEGVRIAREEDHHTTLNPGVVQGLQDRIIYQFGEEGNIIDIASYVMEIIAQNQVYADGNKRTAYITSMMTIIVYQVIELDNKNEILIPPLEENFVDLISKVAIEQKSEDREDIKNYLDLLEKELEK